MLADSDPPAFRLTCAEVPGTAHVVAVSGEVDDPNTAKVDDEVDDLVESGAHHVIVDLLEVPFLHASFPAALLRHVRRLRAGGGDLTIVTDDARISRVFEISGLQSDFNFELTLTDALEDAVAEARP